MATTELNTTGPQVGRFFERYLHHRKGEHAGEPFALEPFQQEFLNEFYERDRRGRRVYRYGYLGIPRGNGKTPLASGLGLYELLVNKDSPDVFTVAGTKDQAAILFDFARGFVEDDEKLGGPEGRGWVKPSRWFLKCYENNGVMRVLASSGLGLHGLNPSAVLFDELHALIYASQDEVYNAMVTALHKRRNSFLLAITTAGYDKETVLGRAYTEALQYEDAEDRYDGCLRIRRDRARKTLVYWYGIPENLAEDWQNPELWRIVNPASFVHIDDLEAQLHAPGFREADFKRLHLNMWTSTRESWLPSGVWNSLRSDLEIPAGAPIHVAVDVGLTHDTTACSWAWQNPDGRVVCRSHVWAVREDLPHHQFVAGGRMRLDLVGDKLRELAADYQVQEVIYDPAMFAAEADRLSDEGFAEMYELAQSGAAIAGAYQGFYQACREGIIAHDGDPVLAAHVEATAADLTERGWRPRKLRSSQVIDACVATAWASWRAQHGEGPSIYETQDLFGLDVPFEDDDEEPEDWFAGDQG